MKTPLALVLLALSFPSAYADDSPSPAAPLTDGNCQEYPQLGSQPIQLSKDVQLFIHQDAHYVWFCYGYPDGSFGTIDLQLTSPGLPEEINLHASAQLGEWPVAKPDLAPKSADSDLWWNNQDWIGNPVWMNGFEKTDKGLSPKFKNAKARELQLSKRRFGSGDWKFRLNIRQIQPADGGKPYDIDFPADGTSHLLKVQ